MSATNDGGDCGVAYDFSCCIVKLNGRELVIAQCFKGF